MGVVLIVGRFCLSFAYDFSTKSNAHPIVFNNRNISIMDRNEYKLNFMKGV